MSRKIVMIMIILAWIIWWGMVGISFPWHFQLIGWTGTLLTVFVR